MKNYHYVIILLLGLTSVPARAFWGIGDVTYDPSNYAQLTAVINQMKEAYQLAKKQLDTLADVQKTIQEGQQAYETIRNFDLEQIKNDLKPTAFNAGTKDKINALRADLSRLETNGQRDTDYYGYQFQRLKNMERLLALQDASAKNVGQSAKNIDPRASGQITAQ